MAQYRGERDSALRGLRDAEGALRTARGGDDRAASGVTVGRQWFETLVRRDEEHLDMIATLEANLFRAEKTRIEVNRDVTKEYSGRIAAQAKLDRIPRFVRRLFGAL